MKKINANLFLMLCMLCFAQLANAQAIKIDRNLWGEWTLESTEQVTMKSGRIMNTEATSTNTIVKKRNSLSEDIFLHIDFFDDNTLALCSVSQANINNTDLQIWDNNEKGSYRIEGNNLIITIYKNEPRIYRFSYEVKEDKLIIRTIQTEGSQSVNVFIYKK